MNAVPITLVDDPLQYRARDEFRPVVATQERRCASFADQPAEHLDDLTRADPAVDLDRQTLLRELVGNRQAFELPPVGTGIEHEIDGPDLVGAVRRVGPRPTTGDALARPSARKLQARAMPQPVGAPRAHRVAVAAK